MANENHDRDGWEAQSARVCDGGSRWTLAAVVALLAFTPGAASAWVGINLRPGAAEPCDVNVNRMNTTAPVADLDQYVGSSIFDWAIVNDGSPGTATLPDAEHVFFETNGKSNTILQLAAQFDMSFTMALTSLGSGGPVYGQDSATAWLFLDNTRTTLFPYTVPYPSHVMMTASLEGVLNVSRGLNSDPIYNLVQSAPSFTKGEFRMFFGADGTGTFRWGHLMDSDPFTGAVTSAAQPNYSVAFQLNIS